MVSVYAKTPWGRFRRITPSLPVFFSFPRLLSNHHTPTPLTSRHLNPLPLPLPSNQLFQKTFLIPSPPPAFLLLALAHAPLEPDRLGAAPAAVVVAGVHACVFVEADGLEAAGGVCKLWGSGGMLAVSFGVGGRWGERKGGREEMLNGMGRDGLKERSENKQRMGRRSG